MFGAECGEALLLLFAEAVERERGLRAALARVLRELLRQGLQTLAGAVGERSQALAEALDALGLLLRHAAELLPHMAAETVETLLQLLPTGALLLAQGALDPGTVVLQRIQFGAHARAVAAAQQRDELQQQHQHKQDDEDDLQDLVEWHGTFPGFDASSVRRAVSWPAPAFHAGMAGVVHDGRSACSRRRSWNMSTIT